MITKDIAKRVIEVALGTGGDFAEIYLEDTITNRLEMADKAVTNVVTNNISGAAIRILHDQEEVYGYTNDISEEALTELALRLSKSFNYDPLNLAISFQEVLTKPISNIKKLATSVKNTDKIKYLETTSNYIYSASEKVIQALVFFTDETQRVEIYNSNGLYRKDMRSHMRLGATCIVKDGERVERFTDTYGGNFGLEKYDEFDLKSFALHIVNCGLDLLKAIDIPGGVYDVVIHNGFGGVIFHESCGHSLEASSVAKNLSVFSNKLGQMIASPLVSAIDDGTICDEWGSLGMDDEGNDTKKNVLIKDGKLVSYMIDSRNGRRMKMAPTGSCRRQSYKFSPTSRMTNTYIENGKSTFAEIIKNTKYGIFAAYMGGGSVDPSTGEFNFTVNLGYLIEDGKITTPIKGATLIGSGANTLLNIDMVGNNRTFGYGMCGASSGSIPACVGEPTIRVKNMTVGGKGVKKE